MQYFRFVFSSCFYRNGKRHPVLLRREIFILYPDISLVHFKKKVALLLKHKHAHYLSVISHHVLSERKTGHDIRPQSFLGWFWGQHLCQHTSAEFPSALNMNILLLLLYYYIIIVSEMQIATKLHRQSWSEHARLQVTATFCEDKSQWQIASCRLENFCEILVRGLATVSS